MEYTIDKMEIQYWEQIKNIYVEGIKTGNATLETEVPNWKEWNKKIY